MQETITIAKQEYDKLKKENSALRNTGLYKRLLEFEKNISAGKKYTRRDLGF